MQIYNSNLFIWNWCALELGERREENKHERRKAMKRLIRIRDTFSAFSRLAADESVGQSQTSWEKHFVSCRDLAPRLALPFDALDLFH